jgi:hypothetical protein
VAPVHVGFGATSVRMGIWNVQSGGWDGYDSTAPFPERLELLESAIWSLNVPLLGLIDTFRWRERFTLGELSRRFRYERVYCINGGGTLIDPRIGLTVMSDSLPGLEFATVWLGTIKAVRVRFLVGNQEVLVYFVYLHHDGEDERLMQLEYVLADAKNYPEAVVVVAGDLNALRPEDNPWLQGLGRVLRWPILRRLPLYPVRSLREVTRGEVVSRLWQAGFVDGRAPGTVAEWGFAPTAQLRLASWMGGLRVPLAVDSAWLKGSMKFRPWNFQVHRGDPYDGASDHRPVTVELHF